LEQPIVIFGVGLLVRQSPIGGVFRVRELEGVDVFGFEDGFWIAGFGYAKHGAAELFGRGDVLREPGFEEREYWIEDGVEGLIELCLGADAVERLDGSRAEHVGGFEGELEEIVFGFAFDAGPHGAAAFGRVGASSGDVEEGHLRVESCEGCGSGEGEVVGEVLVLRLVHPGGGDAKGEEAGVEAGELGFNGGVVEEVGVDEFVEFGVVLIGRSADDGEDLLYVRVEEAFA
jgi:hypothetical protein